MTQVITDIQFCTDASGAFCSHEATTIDLEKEVNRIIDERLARFSSPSTPQPTTADIGTLSW
jgi:hypothetical protein